jgi:hypothetical protein
MARIVVEVSFPTSPQALRLCEELNEPLGWAYAIKLWAWAMSLDCSTGVVQVPNERHLKAVCSYYGRRSFLAAMVSAGILEHVDGISYRIKGWDINSRYFREKDRLSAFREEKRLEKERVQNASRTASETRARLGSPSPSPSPSQSQEREYAHATGLALIPQEHIDPVMAKELYDEYGRAMDLNKRPTRSSLLVSSKELDLCKQILRDCGSRDLAFSAAHAYAECEKNPYWKKHNWALWLLAKDIAQAIELARLPAQEQTA